MFKITTEAIQPDALHEWLCKPHHGAVVTFAGLVRDHTDSRATARLEYEAFEEMAEKKLREVGDEIREKWQIEDVAIIHRLGVLEIGEISILITVAAPHRKHVFEACSYAIDRVKQVVPIWKKEVWKDGEAEWVENRL